MEITTLVQQSGKSRAEICAEAGISPPLLSLIESGKRRVGAGNVKALASALGVTPADLRPDLAAIFDPSQQPRSPGT